MEIPNHHNHFYLFLTHVHKYADIYDGIGMLALKGVVVVEGVLFHIYLQLFLNWIQKYTYTTLWEFWTTCLGYCKICLPDKAPLLVRQVYKGSWTNYAGNCPISLPDETTLLGKGRHFIWIAALKILSDETQL